MYRYIGDAKFGRHVGTDSMGNRYYENMDATQEIPGLLLFQSVSHSWLILAQVGKGG